MTIETLVASLKGLAESRGTGGAIQAGGQAFDLKQCWSVVEGGMQWLRDCGVRAGDRVALIGSNTISFSLTYFAIHATRAIAVPIGPDVSPSGSQIVLEDCRPSLVLAEDPGKCALAGARAIPPVEQWLSTTISSNPACSLDDPADLLFTTGTTGRRKGVLLTHANIASAARNINAFIRCEPYDIEVVPVPLSHSFGLGRLRCWAQTGHTLVLEQGLRNPAALFMRLRELRATGLAIVPAGIALLRLLIKDRFADLAAHLRYVELGSAPLAPIDRKWLLAMLPRTRICHHYGMTEASRAAFTELHADIERKGSIGRASPNVEIMIGDEKGLPLPYGQSGEILVRGGMVMQGYWEQPELTAAVLRNGWLRTGDEGCLDDDGYVYLLGRRNDIINVGGLKVSPEEIEQCLCELEGVKDAGCIGIPDPRGVLGQVVKAFVVCDRDLNAPAIVDELRAKLSEHEIPREFERVAELPRTESGKIKRTELRAREVG